RCAHSEPAPMPHMVAGGQSSERSIEPARINRARAGVSAFQHILPVEVRALAIRRSCRVNDRGVALFEEAPEHRHCGIENEEAIKRNRWMIAASGKRECAV